MDMTAADISAITRPYGYGDGFGFGGGSGIWFLALLFLLGGGNGFFGGRAQAATTEELSAGFNFAGINNKLNELTAGQANINQNLSNAICQLGYQGAQHTYELGSKIDSCCCTTQRAVDSVRFDMANYASAINANIASWGQKVLDARAQDKIDALQAQVNKLQLEQATGCLPRISPVAYGVYPYPTCNTCGYTTNI